MENDNKLDMRSIEIDGKELLRAMKRGLRENPHSHLHVPFEALSADVRNIADSGDRTQFSTGAVRDIHAGKGRMDLLPMTALLELSKHCEAGAQKYGERNIDKGIPQHSLLDSGLRHLVRYMCGDTDENHLVAALWNIAWAVEQDAVRPELNDIPVRSYSEQLIEKSADTASADRNTTPTDLNIKQAISVLQSEFLLHGILYNGFIESIKSAVKELRLEPFQRTERGAAEYILRRVMGEE